MSQLDAAWQAVTGAVAAARRPQGNIDSEAVGVTVLTGFLGSGKTTVLRRLLREPGGLRIAAVVNDVGPINIDAAALDGLRVESQTRDRVELTNGCACCALVDDLADTLERLADPARSDAIVVEASGAADPATLALTVESAAGCRLDGVVAVVDAQHLIGQLDDAQIGPAVCRQIDESHLVVLSKVDQVDEGEVVSLTDRIGELAPGRMVVPATYGSVDPRVLLSAALQGATFRSAVGQHPLVVATSMAIPGGPLDATAVARWFERQPFSLLRAKGWFVGPDGVWHEVQAVGRSWRLLPATGPHEAAIVLIGDCQETVDAAADSLQRLG